MCSELSKIPMPHRSMNMCIICLFIMCVHGCIAWVCVHGCVCMGVCAWACVHGGVCMGVCACVENKDSSAVISLCPHCESRDQTRVFSL